MSKKISNLTVQDFILNIEKKILQAPDKIKNANAVFQLNISGPTGGSWYIAMQDPPELKEGVHENPTLTIEAEDVAFINIIKGNLNPQQALLDNKLNLLGDLSAAFKFGALLKD